MERRDTADFGEILFPAVEITPELPPDPGATLPQRQLPLESSPSLILFFKIFSA